MKQNRIVGGYPDIAGGGRRLGEEGTKKSCYALGREID